MIPNPRRNRRARWLAHVAACALAATTLLSCSSDREWQGHIELIDSIEFTTNPDLPLAPDALQLELLWELHAGLDTLLWTDPSEVLANDHGVYVLDAPGSTIRVIRKEGTPAYAFGGPGSGPGELRVPANLVDTGEMIAVVNGANGRIEMFDYDGTTAGAIPLPGITFDLVSAGPEMLYAYSLRGDTASWQRFSTRQRDASLFVWPQHAAVDTLLSACRHQTAFGDELVQFACDRPAIVISDGSTVKRVIRIERAPVAATHEQLDRFERAILKSIPEVGFPPERVRTFVERQLENHRILRPFRKVVATDERILLWEQIPEDLGGSVATLHVFDRKGAYTGRIEAEEAWKDFAVHQNRLYVLQVDTATDLTSLAAYRFRQHRDF